MSGAFDPADFKALPPEQQRLIAERLLKIQQSNWKPFWCKDHGCNGMPHAVLDANGEELIVGVNDVLGPQGQPVSPVVYERQVEVAGGEPGETEPEWFVSGPHRSETPGPGDVPVGRLVYDPNWAHNHARKDQRLPAWNKRWTLFIMSGRGSGKTRTGVEFVTLNARKGLTGAIIGRRGTELVNTHVAEILANAHPDFMPIHFASKDLLEWPNGAITYLFSAERPENIRSVNLSYCWFDEAAFMDEIEIAWMNAKLATRVRSAGNPIHFLITSTPQGTPWIMKMEDDEDVEVRRVSTYANKANLDVDYVNDLEKEYEGTRMGRQELHGEVLRDVEGALWNDGLFRHRKVTPELFGELVDQLDETVLAIDPAGSKGKRSDATGIIGVGAHIFDENGDHLPVSTFDVLVDATIKGTPTEWARQAFKAARLIKAKRIIAEKNFGGEMVKQVLTDFAVKYPLEALSYEGENMADIVEVVHAVQSKETRAEGTVGKYEQGRVDHVINPSAFGDLSDLEKEQVGWVPKSRGGKLPSPNRIDALVWAMRALEQNVRYKAQVASGGNAVQRIMLPPQYQGPAVPVPPQSEISKMLRKGIRR